MPPADLTLLVQALAAVAAGTAGCCVASVAATAPGRVLGVGLLVAAALTAVDTMPVAGRGLPLAGLALFAFACLATGPRGSRAAGALAAAPLRLAVAGTAAALLLHQAHVVAPHQPAVVLGAPWYPLDVACAVGLGWLAVTQRELAPPLRALLAATALGLAATSFAGAQREAFAAAMLGAGCAGVLWRGLAEAPRCFAVAAATTFAAALTCALRASAAAHAATWSFAGIDDPLLVLAALFAAFGVALHREHGAGVAAPPAPAASEPAPTVPATSDLAAAPTAIAASPPPPPFAPEPAPIPEPTPAPVPADLLDLPDEDDAQRLRAEAEQTVGELVADDDVGATVPDDAPAPARPRAE